MVWMRRMASSSMSETVPFPAVEAMWRAISWA